MYNCTYISYSIFIVKYIRTRDNYNKREEIRNGRKFRWGHGRVLTDGKYNIYLWVTDDKGGISSEIGVEVYMDRTNPKLTIRVK